jgi:phospholipid/cholesterol/gamma-HCH transport system substrate-binding protein
MSRRGAASIVASPVLVGAVTVLIIIVAVFLAYNANQGLPFVPTYDVRAELPHGANLVTGNEVRVGGFRVGIIDKIVPRTIEEDGTTQSIALVDLKLDKVVEPLATDSRLIVRPRSALGLKYIELTPGTAETVYEPGDTIPLANAGDPVEFDDLTNTFDQGLRDDSRGALEGYGDAFAGRGYSLNQTIEALPQFMTSLTSVMDNLNDEQTELDEFFVQIGRTAAQVRPVSDVQAQLFTNMADTFEALSRDPAALRATLEEAPPTLDTAISSFRVQRPFLADTTELSHRLRPAAQELPRSLPSINAALIDGQDVLPRTVAYNRDLENVLRAVDDLAENPNTLLGLQDLDTTTDVAGPLFQHLNPYQSVCNYLTYFFNPLGEHISEPVPGGTIQRVLIRTDPGLETEGDEESGPGSQINRFGASGGREGQAENNANRPADIPIDVWPKEGQYYAFHGQAFQPAATGGRADCQNGQQGFLAGPLNPPGSKYGPADFDNTNPVNPPEPSARNVAGGSSTVGASDIPYRGNGGRAGPTFNQNERDGLNPRSLGEVP